MSRFLTTACWVELSLLRANGMSAYMVVASSISSAIDCLVFLCFVCVCRLVVSLVSSSQL